MSNRLLSALGGDSPLVLDGAMGTMLQQLGLGLGECPELWNIKHPDRIREVHKGYLKAGADIIVTNTFGASPKKLAMFGIEEKTEEINRAGAILACEARNLAGKDKTAFIFGGIGPTGELLEPLGAASASDLHQHFKRQTEALVSGGVDAVIVETMLSPEEALIAAGAAKAVDAKLPVFVNLTFDPTPHGPRTMMGTSPADFVVMIENQKIDLQGVGTNCGTGARDMLRVVESYRAKTKLPIVAYPNAGFPKMVNEQTVYDQTPDEFATEAEKLFDAGASIIGGCCGTTPEHIRHLKKKLVQRSPGPIGGGHV
ncbi:homocysteine S-methyltransferase family protein [bacterium]|nr:homocysteine S-methyltransferase family protein [bacterium]